MLSVYRREKPLSEEVELVRKSMLSAFTFAVVDAVDGVVVGGRPGLVEGGAGVD